MEISKIIDLSIKISAQTPIYEGDPKPHLHSSAELLTDGFNVSALHLGSHTGTHIDAPFHFIQDGETIDQVSLHKVMGRGIIFDVKGKEKASPITLNDVEATISQCREGDIALFYTGWTQYIDDPIYFEHPYIDVAVIEELLKRSVKTIFIDALNIDPPHGQSFPAHEMILGANGIIGENFTNFDQIDFKDPFIIALPLKLEGVDGSPVRAVAVEFRG